MSADDTATVRIEIKNRLCPKCEARSPENEVIANQYRCLQCGYELAHLDLTATGGVRGVFGWMKEAGEIIAERYRIRTVLGRGGFGATYLVEDQRVNGKRWALKEIPELLFDEFEVSLLSNLDHPAIPIIVDRFTRDGMVYLVLKFGGNRTLQSESRRQQRIPYARLKPWALQLGDVLRYLHHLNPPVIHRDLKPENVLLDDGDRVMLIDFGIAKESSSSMTRTLGRAASHGFSPPEQVLGTGTDQRSDIYSFAATLYFALTGQIPAAAHERVAGKALSPPAEFAPDLPGTVNAILMKALTLNINERPQRVEDVLAVLEGGQAGPVTGGIDMSGKTVAIGDLSFGPGTLTAGIASRPLETARSPAAAGQGRKLAWLGGSVASLLLLAGGVYWWSQREPETPPASSSPVPAAQPAAAVAPSPPAATAALPTPQPQTPQAPPVATAPQPAPQGGSALEMLNTRRTAEPEAPEEQHPAPRQSSIETSITSRPARSTSSTPPRRAARSEPAPSAPPPDNSGGGGGSGWNIIPGQTQKIR